MNEQQFNQMLKRQNLTCRRQRQRQLLAGVADATGHWTHRRQQRSDLLRYAAAACLFLFLLLPASLSAKETSVRYSPDSSYDYMASITNLDTSVRAL